MSDVQQQEIPTTTVAVRLTLRLSTGWGPRRHETERVFTDQTPIVAFGKAYRWARTLMGDYRCADSAWVAQPYPGGWSLETMDALGYDVDIIVDHETWDAHHPRSTTPKAPRADHVEDPRAWSDWYVTVPVTLLVGATTPARAMTRACELVENASGAGLAMVPMDANIDVQAL